MEDINKRLRDNADACIKAFEVWTAQNKSIESREPLMEAMHEVRKVLARVEIEIAVSERDRLGSRPLPIPPHRSSRKRPGEVEEGNDTSEDYDNFEAEQQQQGQPSGQQENRRPQHGRHRRPMQNRGSNLGQSGGNGGGNNSSDNQPQ